MKKKKEFSYQDQKEKLEHIIETINNTNSFEQKKDLYLEGISLIKELETLLTTEQEIITHIIKE